MTTIGSSIPTYDANGNVTNDFLYQYTWDANGRPITILGPTNITVSAVYDALGRIAEFSYSGNTREVVYSPQGGKLALMNGQSLVTAFIPLTGGATAVYGPGGLAYYRHPDWLGSARLATTTTQTMYNDVAYAPYGETYAQSGTPDFSFTGMNEDVEQNANPATLYDFPAREYGIQGRWPSPDPLGLGAVNFADPQSWNRYAYVGNRPLAATDPTGLFLGPLPPTDGGPCWVCDIAIGIFDIFSILFGGGGPPPQAPPPPPGGYGAGLDPFCGDFVSCGQMPSFHMPMPGLPGSWYCNYNPGSCSGIIIGFMQGSGGPQWTNYFDYLRWLKTALTLAGSTVVGFPDLPTSGNQSPNFEAYQQCISQFFSNEYGPGAQSYVEATSLFNTFTKEGGLTTIGIELGKLTIGGWGKLAGASTSEIGGAFLIPTGVGTLYDVQSRFACSGVSGANPPPF